MTTGLNTSSYGLLRAAEAITNLRALAMCAAAGLATFLCVMLMFYLGSHSIALYFLMTLVTVVVSMIGYSAVGITLMRQAQGQTVGFVDAILQATFTLHRFLGVGLLLVLGYVGVILATLVLFLICKLPALGSLLFAFGFPVAAILIGLVTIGMWYVGFPLAAPAIWEGNNTFQTVARLVQIGRQRLMTVIVSMFLLTILVFFLSAIVFGVLFTGSSAATGLATMVGVGPGAGSLIGLASMAGLGGFGGYGSYGGFGGYGGGSGQLVAFYFGIGLLLTIGMIIPYLTFINGTCLVYLQTTEGMDFSASEEALRKKMDDAKRKTEEIRKRAEERMQEAKEGKRNSAPEAVPVGPAAVPPAAAATARSCTQCQAPLAAEDAFCGECGTKNPL